MQAIGILASTMCLCTAGLAPPIRRPAPPLLRDRPVTWSNPQGSTLTEIADDVWLAERPFYPRLPGLQGTDVGCKMCVVRLPDGKLWVHGPVQLDTALRDAVGKLGPIGHIVTPNTEHQKYAPEWIRAYPDAASYACPGLRERSPEGGWRRSLEELLAPGGVSSTSPPAEWGGALQLCWVKDRVPLTRGRPFFNEVVFCHVPSKTFICSDLWWNYPGGAADVTPPVEVPLTSRLWKAGMDRVYRPVYNGLMHADGWDDACDVILGWDFEYLAPAHGEPVRVDAKAVLARHLGVERSE